MVFTSRALLALLAAAACAAATAQDMQMRHLAKGMTTEATTGDAFMVVRTEDDLTRALNHRMNLEPGQAITGGRPGIDFDTEMAVGVLLSNRPTSCTGVDITSISKDGIVSVVHYRERKRQPRETCTVAATSPFDFVAIPKSSAPVRFQADDQP